MHGLHGESGPAAIIIILGLELLFLGASAVLVGLGISEIRKKKPIAKNSFFILLGLALAALSLYVTKILLQG